MRSLLIVLLACLPLAVLTAAALVKPIVEQPQHRPEIERPELWRAEYRARSIGRQVAAEKPLADQLAAADAFAPRPVAEAVPDDSRLKPVADSWADWQKRHAQVADYLRISRAAAEGSLPQLQAAVGQLEKLRSKHVEAASAAGKEFRGHLDATIAEFQRRIVAETRRAEAEKALAEQRYDECASLCDRLLADYRGEIASQSKATQTLRARTTFLKATADLERQIQPAASLERRLALLEAYLQKYPEETLPAGDRAIVRARAAAYRCARAEEAFDAEDYQRCRTLCEELEADCQNVPNVSRVLAEAAALKRRVEFRLDSRQLDGQLARPASVERRRELLESYLQRYGRGDALQEDDRGILAQRQLRLAGVQKQIAAEALYEKAQQAFADEQYGECGKACDELIGLCDESISGLPEVSRMVTGAGALGRRAKFRLATLELDSQIAPQSPPAEQSRLLQDYLAKHAGADCLTDDDRRIIQEKKGRLDELKEMLAAAELYAAAEEAFKNGQYDQAAELCDEVARKYARLDDQVAAAERLKQRAGFRSATAYLETKLGKHPPPSDQRRLLEGYLKQWPQAQALDQRDRQVLQEKKLLLADVEKRIAAEALHDQARELFDKALYRQCAQQCGECLKRYGELVDHDPQLSGKLAAAEALKRRAEFRDDHAQFVSLLAEASGDDARLRMLKSFLQKYAGAESLDPSDRQMIAALQRQSSTLEGADLYDKAQGAFRLGEYPRCETLCDRLLGEYSAVLAESQKQSVRILRQRAVFRRGARQLDMELAKDPPLEQRLRLLQNHLKTYAAANRPGEAEWQTVEAEARNVQDFKQLMSAGENQLAAIQAVLQLRAAPPPNVFDRLKRAVAILDTCPISAIKKPLTAHARNWLAESLPEKTFQKPSAVREVVTRQQGGRGEVFRGYFKELKAADGRLLGYKFYPTLKEFLRPSGQVGTIRIAQVVHGPGSALPGRCVAQYGAARTALLARLHDKQTWSEYAAVCGRLQQELENYRKLPGHLEEDTSFKSEAAFASQLLDERNWRNVEKLLP